MPVETTIEMDGNEIVSIATSTRATFQAHPAPGPCIDGFTGMPVETGTSVPLAEMLLISALEPFPPGLEALYRQRGIWRIAETPNAVPQVPGARRLVTSDVKRRL